MPVRMVVLQPTSLCNLNCNYCYVGNRRDAARMSMATLEVTIRAVLGSEIVAEEVEFLWHAGEPLTVGIGFYRTALALMERHNVRARHYTNTIQTNGTLINEEWCRFFRDADIGVGLSIDGPAFLHDRRRFTWSGRPTHDRVMRSYRLLREYGITPGALCVLTRETLDHPDELFIFFYEHGFKWIGLNVEEVESVHAVSSLRGANEAEALKVVEKYRYFVSRLYDLWRPHAHEIEIREFADLLDVLRRKLEDKDYCRMPDETKDLCILTVQKNGDITTYSPEFAGGLSAEYGNFVVGNVHDCRLDEISRHPVYRHLQRSVHQGVARCAESCFYFDLCGGAFLSNRYFEAGSIEATETTTCRLHRQALADVLLEKLSHESLLKTQSHLSLPS